MWLIIVWDGQHSVAVPNTAISHIICGSRICRTAAAILTAATPPPPMAKVLMDVVTAETHADKRCTLLPRVCPHGHGRTSTPICKPNSAPTTSPSNQNTSDKRGARGHLCHLCPLLSTVCPTMSLASTFLFSTIRSLVIHNNTILGVAVVSTHSRPDLIVVPFPYFLPRRHCPCPCF